MRFIFGVFFIYYSVICSGQDAASDSDISTDSLRIHDFVAYDATYPGGDSVRQQFISEFITKKLKSYNYKKLRKGTVYVSFVIEKDGSISNVHILGVGIENEDQNNWAVEAVKNMPKWTPAELDGKPVRQRFRIPITY